MAGLQRQRAQTQRKGTAQAGIRPRQRVHDAGVGQRLAAASGALQQHWHAVGVRVRIERDLVARRLIERLVLQPVAA